jgi:hypothetical protein
MLGGQSGKINYPIRNFVGYIGILGGKLRMQSEVRKVRYRGSKTLITVETQVKSR